MITNGRGVLRSGALVVLFALSAGCADLYEVDPAYAARADSSAAGYMVDVVETAAVPIDSSPAIRQPVRRPPPPPPSPVREAESPPHVDTSVSEDSAAPDSSIVDDSVTTGPDIATLPPELSTPANDSVVVNTWLAFNPAARVVWVDLIAGLDGTNGALNFNGGHAGSQTIAVPLGWRVEVRIANRDQDLSHSAVVVHQIDPIPVLAPTAAFPGSFSIALEEGLVAGRSDAFRFSADREGRYMMMCAVPGHAQSGMWLHFEVSPTLTIPEYRR